MMKTPKIKNFSSPQSLTSDHDTFLNFCEHIRTGLRENIDISRLRSYADWFGDHHLEPHFAIEEQLIFPQLGKNVRVKKALANHRRIKKLLACACDDEKVLNLLEEELRTYVRFEERVIFKELKNKIPSEVLSGWDRQPDEANENETWKDEFWKS